MEQLAQVLLPIKTGGYENFSVGIAHPSRSHRASQNESTIQPTIMHSNQPTGLGHSDWEYYPLGIFRNGTDFRSGGSGRSIDNRTGTKLLEPTRTIILEINSKRRFPFRAMSDFTIWNVMRNDTGRIEGPVFNNIFENYERKNILKVEKVGRKYYVICT